MAPLTTGRTPTTLRVKASVSASPCESVAVKVYVVCGLSIPGVPESAPVAAFTPSPSGSAGDTA